jgi:hypothetical protein
MKSKKRYRAIAGTSLLLGLYGAVAVTSSNAALAATEKTAIDKTQSHSSRIETISKSCLNAVSESNRVHRRNISSELCRVSVVTTYGDPEVADIADIADISTARLKISKSDFAHLRAAAVLGTLRSRTYSQQRNNITDSETQSGTFYYDGTRAWVATSYRGVSGSHRCSLDWAAGYSVALQGCFDTGSTSQRTIAQQWLFTPFVNGFPLTWSETYSIKVDALGQVW